MSPSAAQAPCSTQQVIAGDADGLRRFLAEQGVEAADVAELERALAEDQKPKAGQPLGKRVSGWIGQMVSKAASGAWKITTSSAADILTAAVRAYYNLNYACGWQCRVPARARV